MHSFSIIIPVLDESSIINHTVEQIFRMGSGFPVEVIVIDGDKEGKTINVLTNREVITGTSLRGRGRQMNKGASVATGEILVFLHTDTELPEHALRAISSVMDDAKYAGGAFDLGIKSGRSVFRLLEKLVCLRTRITRIPYGDQAIFIRKGVFDSLAGYKEIPLMEDVEFMGRMKRLGYNICIIPQKVRTSPRRWEKEGIVYCTLRNLILQGLYHLGVKPDKLVKFYYRDWDKYIQAQ
jgi:rSAM/selenodomain-associated transferase 2